jgi:hypothetical protein
MATWLYFYNEERFSPQKILQSKDATITSLSWSITCYVQHEIQVTFTFDWI